MANSTSPSIDSDQLDTRREIRRAILDVAWQRKSLVALGLVVGVVLGLLYYAQSVPVYSCKAQILVVKKRAAEMVDTRNMPIEDYVATHQILIRSPSIAEEAVRKRNLGTLESLAKVDEADVMDSILGGLTVTRNKAAGATNSNILDLTCASTKASDCPVIMNAIIESYQKFLEDTYRSTSKEAVTLITNAREKLDSELESAQKDYEDFRNNAPILLSRGKEGSQIHESVSALKKTLAEVLIKKAYIKSYVAAIDQHLKKGSRPQAMLPMLAEWRNKLEGETNKYGGTLTMNNQLVPLLIEQEKLRETRGVNHPEFETMRKKIDVVRDSLSNPTALYDPSRTSSEKEALGSQHSVEAYRSFFSEELNSLEIQEKLLTDYFKEEQESAKILINYEHKDETHRAIIDRKIKAYDAIIKKLSEVDLIKDAGGYEAKMIAPPAIGRKIAPRRLHIFSVAMFGGLLFGFGLAYLAELSDKGFHTVDEIRRRLGVTVIGQIPHLDPTEESTQQLLPNGRMLDPMLCAHYHAKSPNSECFRGIRTALFFSAQGGHKVIQVTSPNGGDGKSTVTANLAISIAQAGKKVILIDADLRKPRVHKIFGMSANIGLASILTGETDPQDAIQDSGIPNLSILPTGPLPPNPAELLTSIRLKELLESLRDQYDFILVDTPPLLVVTDPSVVAPRVDGVLLNIRLTKNARPQAERAKAILETLGVTIFGVIVNDAESRAASYGHYSYSNSYYYTSDAETAQEAAAATKLVTDVQAKADADAKDVNG